MVLEMFQLQLIKEECVFRELDSLMMPRSTEKSQGVKIYRYVGQHQDSILDLTNQALDVYADALHLYQVCSQLHTPSMLSLACRRNLRSRDWVSRTPGTI